MKNWLMKYGTLLPGVPRLMKNKPLWKQPVRGPIEPTNRIYFRADRDVEFIGAVAAASLPPAGFPFYQELPVDVLFLHSWGATKVGFRQVCREGRGIVYTRIGHNGPHRPAFPELDGVLTNRFGVVETHHVPVTHAHLLNVGKLPTPLVGDLIHVKAISVDLMIQNSAGKFELLASAGRPGSSDCPLLEIKEWTVLKNLSHSTSRGATQGVECMASQTRTQLDYSV